MFDTWPYLSPMRRTHPGLKACVALAGLVCSLVSGSFLTLLCILTLFLGITVWWGGVRPLILLGYMAIPILSIAPGVLVLSLTLGAPEGLSSLGKTLAFRPDALEVSMVVASRALAAVSALYFLALTTPITDLAWLLRRLRVPGTAVELFALGHRYIHLFLKASQSIRKAQVSRLGYQGAVSSLHSLAYLTSSLFARCLFLSGQLSDSMESRNYTGTISVLEEEYSLSTPEVCRGAGFITVLVLLTLMGGK
ncbi:MAG: cobalt ECF transporter T component CbiQ [Bacillota bacterium]